MIYSLGKLVTKYKPTVVVLSNCTSKFKPCNYYCNSQHDFFTGKKNYVYWPSTNQSISSGDMTVKGLTENWIFKDFAHRIREFDLTKVIFELQDHNLN